MSSYEVIALTFEELSPPDPHAYTLPGPVFEDLSEPDLPRALLSKIFEDLSEPELPRALLSQLTEFLGIDKLVRALSSAVELLGWDSHVMLLSRIAETLRSELVFEIDIAAPKIFVSARVIAAIIAFFACSITFAYYLERVERTRRLRDFVRLLLWAIMVSIALSAILHLVTLIPPELGISLP